MRRRHHGLAGSCSIGRFGVGQEVGDAGERLVGFGVEHMEDRADQERVAGLLPVIAPFQRALGIDQDIGDVLDVAHFGVAAPDFEQRIVGGGCRIGRIEQQHAAEPRPPAGRELPVLALDVVDDGRSGPGQERRDDEPDALAGAGRRKAEHMLRPVVPKIVAAEATKHDAVRIEEPGGANFVPASPSAPSHRS